MNLGWTEILLILIIVLAIFLVPMILFLLTQQNILKAIRPDNRRIQPGEVWLQLIPLFNIVWQFIVVSRISESIRNEINGRAADSFLGAANPIFANDVEPRPTYSIGLAYCILGLCGIIPLLGWLASLAALVCWIIYWTQIAAYKNKFLNNPI